MTGRAVVMEVENGFCTVLTDDGEFRRLKMKGTYRPGQVINLPAVKWNTGRYAMAAACVLLMLAVTAVWQFMTVPAVASYVSMDINPSLELALDEDNVVREVKSLDDAGNQLISGLELEGGSLEYTLEQIVLAAIGKNYIRPEAENIILFTVTPVGDRDPSTVDQLVKESIAAPLRGKNIKARVVVGNVTPEIREKSQETGISPGRYLLLQDAAKKGLDIKPEELKSKSIQSIEKEHKIKIQDAIEAVSRDIMGDLKYKKTRTDDDGKNDWGNPPGRDDSGKNRIDGEKKIKTPANGTKPPGQDNLSKKQRQGNNGKDGKKGNHNMEEKKGKTALYDFQAQTDWKRFFSRDGG